MVMRWKEEQEATLAVEPTPWLRKEHTTDSDDLSAIRCGDVDGVGEDEGGCSGDVEMLSHGVTFCVGRKRLISERVRAWSVACQLSM